MIVIDYSERYPYVYSETEGNKRLVFDDIVFYYALGCEPPHHPVPAIQYKVCFYASGDCVEIRSFKGVDSKRSYIEKIFWKPV